MSTGKEEVLFNLLDPVGTKKYRVKLSQKKLSPEWGKMDYKAMRFSGSSPKEDANRKVFSFGDWSAFFQKRLSQPMTSEHCFLPGDPFQPHRPLLCTAKPWQSLGTSNLIGSKCVLSGRWQLGRGGEKLSALKFTSTLLSESNWVHWPVGHVTSSLYPLLISPTELDKMILYLWFGNTFVLST